MYLKNYFISNLKKWDFQKSNPANQQDFQNQADTIWMFGKMYRRDFLDKYNIKMNDTRANEDNGFNMLVKFLCCNEMERIKFIGDLVYLSYGC